MGEYASGADDAEGMLMRRSIAAALTFALAMLAAPSADATAPEGCGAFDTQIPECEYTATTNGGLGGYGAQPGGWKVTIVRKGWRRPLVVSSAGGMETYPCGTIMPGDKVTATSGPGSGVFVGNPGFCI